ncbi:MAG: hypothetical protein E7362_04225 [Clostridiales bacterium]|nr:hypothetical protein [Clostridiales bacterium]
MKKKFVAILFMLMAVCLSAVCFTACFGGGDPVAVESVTLNKANLTLEVGEEETLTATVTPSNATDKSVIWASEDEQIATVSNGTVTAVSEGETIISVITFDGQKTASCMVTVVSADGPTDPENPVDPEEPTDPEQPTDPESPIDPEEPVQGTEGLVFTKIDGKEEYAVTGVANRSATEIVIPTTYLNLPVTSIGDSAFVSCELLTNVEIPNSVESIGDSAFISCISLTSVEIPNSVTSISDSAFAYCYSLTSVTIPNSVTSIGNDAFNSCVLLTNVTIPNSVTSIGNNAFYSCISLTSVEIPSRVISIRDYAFSHCRSLTSVTIPDNVESIGEQTFFGCTSLTSITIPDNVTSIGNAAFGDCYRLVEVINKSSHIAVTKESSDNGRVGYYAISVFNSGDTYVNKFSTDSDGYVTYTDGEEKMLVNYVGDATDLTTPSDITAINQYAFYDNDNITSIVIPNSVTSIGNDAFTFCEALTSVEIPNSVTSIGKYVFAHCTLLTNVEIPNRVTSIGDGAFNACYSLTSVEIPESVTSIGESAFYGCFRLVEVINKSSHITVTKENSDNGYVGYYAISVSNWDDSYVSKISTDSNGYVTYTDGEEKILVNYVGDATDLTMPSDITAINQYAFYDNDNITSVEIGGSVTSIGTQTFYSCNSLKNVTIGEGVTSIGESAFAYCYLLTSVTFIDTSDWYRTDSFSEWQNKNGGTQMSVTNPLSNATNLKSSYSYYWYKI